jgi:hypothetical protein
MGIERSALRYYAIAGSQAIAKAGRRVRMKNIRYFLIFNIQ